MPIRSLKSFLRAYQEVKYDWKPLDEVIFRACREMRSHRSQPKIFAKIALINRTYRANLGRGSGVQWVEWKVANEYIKERTDSILAPLSKVKVFSRTSLPVVLEAHERFVQITHKVTNRVENSFCSKYLSFHFPDVVPIFDNKAYDTSRRLVRNQLKKGLGANRWNFHYIRHCGALLILIDYLRDHGYRNPKLKRIDNVLYEKAY